MSNELEALASQDPALPRLQPYEGANAHTPYLETQDAKLHRKVCGSLEEAIKRTGLKMG